jgi:asparagine synthase (glutamine-hydrolysing)
LEQNVSGICGWYGDAGGNPKDVIEAMQQRFSWRHPGSRPTANGARFGLAAAGPAGTAAIHEAGPIHVAIQGHPTWLGPNAGRNSLDALCRAAVAGWIDRGDEMLADIGGDFALALVDERSGRVLLAIDRIGVRSVVFQNDADNLIFGPTSDVIGAHPRSRRTIAPQALYDYVYFHMVPGPQSIYREHTRLMPSQCASFDRGRATTRNYWTMRFDEDRRGSVSDFKPAFRDALRVAVAAHAGHGRCGAFLSGGTDSSTVAGVLGEVMGLPASTYSIGFDAAGYDEMEYARIAARHFRTDHHEYYVTPGDVVAAVPLIAAAYDQPFGNASVVPTYYCARRAAEDGVERMLGGDGGDELFGGNSRYARQYQLALYERLPDAARALLSTVLFGLPGSGKVPLLRRGRSYVEQARQPMPARYESYNLLERLGPENVFSMEFLAEVDRGMPLSRLEQVYGAAQADSLINRMLALDIKFTLADNDLPKVTRACELAGVDVVFPLLHEAVVDFSLVLPPDFKLRGTRLRYFFKEALRDFLPDAIIRKHKHGFGLPTGVWLRDNTQLRQLAGDALAGLRKRRIFNDRMLDELMTRRLQEHAGYYGTLAWVLMMLELWFESHAATGTAIGKSS